MWAMTMIGSLCVLPYWRRSSWQKVSGMDEECCSEILLSADLGFLTASNSRVNAKDDINRHGEGPGNLRPTANKYDLVKLSFIAHASLQKEAFSFETSPPSILSLSCLAGIMASLSPSYPCNIHAGRRLSELLEEQQEPFDLEFYLLEHGCSGRIITANAMPFCWPLNACRRLRKLGTHVSCSRSRAAGFLTSMLAKRLDHKARNKNGNIGRPSSPSDCFSEEDSKQELSPVSVLELHSEERSQKDSKFCKFIQGRRILLGCMKEAEERIWSCHGCLSSEMFETIKNELIISRERQKSDVTNLSRMIASEFSSFKEEWRQQLEPESKEVGLRIEAAIFEDLRKEAVMDILTF
ncbi:hypothetical protein AXF42_Ash004143 [Apostasia shenzhenica]|uniref:DUF4378 domain-containing protein n=1 Tax=Apostasia shenzhenica TaxID=1088818 RepID=A0A2I0A260_9ASPA|nr:hypothetical protein AXF42_Ash004143 [Apostasia shenzhenica]